jgi:hypothetical protein
MKSREFKWIEKRKQHKMIKKSRFYKLLLESGWVE